MPRDQEKSASGDEKVGLCMSCRFRREQVANRGTMYVRCARADHDETLGRYPTLPVRECHGHEREDAAGME